MARESVCVTNACAMKAGNTTQEATLKVVGALPLKNLAEAGAVNATGMVPVYVEGAAVLMDGLVSYANASQVALQKTVAVMEIAFVINVNAIWAGIWTQMVNAIAMSRKRVIETRGNFAMHRLDAIHAYPPTQKIFPAGGVKPSASALPKRLRAMRIALFPRFPVQLLQQNGQRPRAPLLIRQAPFSAFFLESLAGASVFLSLLGFILDIKTRKSGRSSKGRGKRSFGPTPPTHYLFHEPKKF